MGGDSPSAEESLSPDPALIRIALVFAGVYALLQATLWYVGSLGWLEPTLTVTAGITGALSNLTGVPATVIGNEVHLSSRILRMDPACTAIPLAILYTALVLAYPLSMWKRTIGTLVGLLLLFLANFVRLTAVAQLSAPLADDTFMFVHDYLFMIAMIAVVIGLWAAYLAWARRSVR
jgi:exosortase/archaeosortase family protein